MVRWLWSDMGYHVVDTDEVDPDPDRPCTRRSLSELAGLSEMAINRFEADPGDQLPLAYHYHETQEEAFYVLSGTLHVETPEGDLTVPEGGVFAADPESPHRAYNPGDAEAAVELLAVGAPPADDDAVAYDPEDP